jgi:hypothetical protein
MQAIPMALAAAGSLIGGIEENGALNAAARADLENARLTTLQGELDAQDTRREERLAAGAGLAMAAGGGEALGTGTIADLFEQSALNREMDIANLRVQAAGEAKNLTDAAKAKRKAAKFALIKGIIGAGSAVASGVNANKNNAAISAASARDRASQAGPLGRGLMPGLGTYGGTYSGTRDGPFRRKPISVFGSPGGL